MQCLITSACLRFSRRLTFPMGHRSPSHQRAQQAGSRGMTSDLLCSSRSINSAATNAKPSFGKSQTSATAQMNCFCCINVILIDKPIFLPFSLSRSHVSLGRDYSAPPTQAPSVSSAPTVSHTHEELQSIHPIIPHIVGSKVIER